MAHCQTPHAFSSAYRYRKLYTTGEFFCSSGLKDGVCFKDVEKRIFHSTYRATHYLMASIAPILPLGDGSSRVNSSPNAEESIHSVECIDESEGPICFADGAQHNSSSKVHIYVQTSIGCIDSETEQGNFDGFDASTMLSTHPGASSLLSSEPLQNGHANAPLNFPLSEGVRNPTSLCFCVSNFEILEPYGVSEFCIEHPETPSTPIFQPAVQSWDFEDLGNGDAKDNFCTMENVRIDDDEKESLVLEENDKMSACIGSCSTERVIGKDSYCTVENAHTKDGDDGDRLFLEEEDAITACVNVCSTRMSDVKDSFCTIEDFCNNDDNDWDSLALEENDIKAACIGGCLFKTDGALMQEHEVVSTEDNSLYSPSYTSFACWKGANTNHSSQMSDCSDCRWRRIWKVFNYMEIFSLVICDTCTKKKLFYQTLPTSRFRLTLQKLVKLLKRRGLNLEVAVAAEQLMAYSDIYLRVCRPRHFPTPGRRALAASCYSRLFLGKQSPSVENLHTRGATHYKKVNVHIIFQDHQKCYLKGRRNHVSCKCLFLKHNISGIEQESQYASMPGVDVASTSSWFLEARDEKFPRSTEPSSDGCNGVKIPQGSLEHDDRGSFESDQSSQNLFSGTSGGSTSKLPYLVEVRDGGMTRSRELSLDELKEDIRESAGFPSQMSVNEVDDWTSIPADQVDECLDTCLYNLQHHSTFSTHNFTTELKLLDPVIVGNPFKPANSTNDSLNDEGSQIFVVNANDNANNISCLPVAGPHSHTLSRCIASLSFDREDLRSSMPYGGVNEKQSKEKLEHFVDGFLLRRHIRRQQRRAQQAPPFPPRVSAGYAHKNQGVSGNSLGERKPKPYIIRSIENNNEPAMTLTSSTGGDDRFVGTDVVIDIVALITYIESQCSQLKTFSHSAANSTNFTDMPLSGGQVVSLNIGAVIVTIIAIIVYTRTLLEGGLAWVGARTQKEEDN